MDKNPVYQNLLKRRSVRQYKPDLPTQEQMNLLVQAGQYAPTGMGKQDTAFIAVTNPEMVKTLSRLNADVLRQNNPAYDADPFYGAPAVIAVLAADTPNAVKNGSAAIENILLAATAMQLGSCWINRGEEVFASPEGQEILKALDIPENYKGVAFVIVGYSDAPEKAAPERTSIVRMVE